MTTLATASFLHDWLDDLPSLMHGLLISLRVTLLSVMLGLGLGVMLSAMVDSKHRVSRLTALALIELGRGFPALVLLYLVYYGFADTGLILGAELTGIIALGFNFACFASGYIRGGYLAVPRGQHEAGMALGLMPAAQLRFVILPQVLRVSIPPLVSLAILTFQTSALLFAIAVPELLSRAYLIGSTTFDYLSPLCLAGVLYATISIPASHMVNRLERRLARRLA